MTQILIAEDSQEVAKLLKRLLKKDYEILIVENGQQVIDQVNKNNKTLKWWLDN